jgi:hypothetical protein
MDEAVEAAGSTKQRKRLQAATVEVELPGLGCESRGCQVLSPCSWDDPMRVRMQAGELGGGSGGHSCLAV